MIAPIAVPHTVPTLPTQTPSPVLVHTPKAPVAVPTLPQKVPGLQQMKPGTPVKDKHGKVIGTVQKGNNGKNVIAPIAVPGATPQLTPTAIPHNAVPIAKPMAVPGKVPTAAQTQVPVPVKPPKVTAQPVSAPKAIPVSQSTGKKTPSGINSRLKAGRVDEIIEPGIRNKEVEAYRTKDAKQVIYKDTIKQDDKNVTLPSKNRK